MKPQYKKIKKHSKGKPCPYCGSSEGFYGNSFGKIKRQYSVNYRVVRFKDEVEKVSHDPKTLTCLSCHKKVKIT